MSAKMTTTEWGNLGSTGRDTVGQPAVSTDSWLTIDDGDVGPSVPVAASGQIDHHDEALATANERSTLATVTADRSDDGAGDTSQGYSDGEGNDGDGNHDRYEQ